MKFWSWGIVYGIGGGGGRGRGGGAGAGAGAEEEYGAWVGKAASRRHVARGTDVQYRGVTATHRGEYTGYVKVKVKGREVIVYSSQSHTPHMGKQIATSQNQHTPGAPRTATHRACLGSNPCTLPASCVLRHVVTQALLGERGSCICDERVKRHVRVHQY